MQIMLIFQPGFQPQAEDAPGSSVSDDLRPAAPAPSAALSEADSLPAAAAEAASCACALLASAATGAASDASNTTPSGFTRAPTAMPLMPAQQTGAARASQHASADTSTPSISTALSILPQQHLLLALMEH